MLDFIRGIVRPSLSWIGFLSITIMILKEIEVPAFYIAMVSSMWTFWFVGRVNNHTPPPNNGTTVTTPNP